MRVIVFLWLCFEDLKYKFTTSMTYGVSSTIEHMFEGRRISRWEASKYYERKRSDG